MLILSWLNMSLESLGYLSPDTVTKVTEDA